MTDDMGATMVCRSAAVTDSTEIPPPTPTGLRPVYLIVVHGGIPGAMLRLPHGGNRLGRSIDNGVQLPDPGVSRRHATAVTDATGEVWLTDLDSTNGTFVNGERLPAHAPCRLDDGDRIRFGSGFVVKFVRLDPSDEKFQRELFERSVRDPLTGLYNRAFFLDQIGPLADASASRGLGLAVLMLDVDHFKRVNDTYGHDSGDAVLREVAAVLRESTRSEDLVARYGGEEFVAALPVAAPDQATDRAERIRANLAARRLKSETADAKGSLRVTASLGLAFTPTGRFRSPSSLITAADHCLYQAKAAGRNRIVFRGDANLALGESHGSGVDLLTPRSGG